jgi:ABC-type phosphate transport system substrate-binding protein
MLESMPKPASRILAGALAVAACVLIGAAGADNAAATCFTTMKGQGSALQKVLQVSVWSPGYVSAGCGTGSNAEAEYTTTSNEEGLIAWGFTATALNHEWAYIGTDDAPTAAQISSARTEAGVGSNVVVVPVAQTAIAVLVHPPEGCTLEKITNEKLERAFSGDAETWAEIGGVGLPCTGSLTRVVRQDPAGVTAQFKNYLASVNKLRNGGTEAASCTGQAKWSELEEIGKGGVPNTEWPECGAIPETAIKGGGEVASTVTAMSGSIGYATLLDAKAHGASVAKVQNNGVSGSPVYASPAAGTEEANCGKAEYAVPAAGQKGTGTGLNVDWSKVFGGNPSIGGTVYPICMLTYDLGWQSYTTAGFAAGIGSSVKAFYEYIVSNGTGSGTVKKWFANLPTAVKSAAEFAASKIS